MNGGRGGPQPPSGVKPIPVLSWPLLGVLALLLGWLGGAPPQVGPENASVLMTSHEHPLLAPLVAGGVA